MSTDQHDTSCPNYEPKTDYNFGVLLCVFFPPVVEPMKNVRIIKHSERIFVVPFRIGLTKFMSARSVVNEL